jgi:hypothetical protein
MTVRDLFAADVRLLGHAKVSINTATTTSFDFGTPDDLNLAALSGYHHADKILVVFTATTAGTTDPVSFVVQDAPDSAGSIGATAAAVTDGTLTGGTGDQVAHTAVQLQAGRPWLRCRVTRTGTTDTHVVTCAVYAVNGSVV